MIPDIVQLFHPNKLAENQLERKVSLLVKDEYSKLLQQKSVQCDSEIYVIIA